MEEFPAGIQFVPLADLLEIEKELEHLKWLRESIPLEYDSPSEWVRGFLALKARVAELEADKMFEETSIKLANKITTLEEKLKVARDGLEQIAEHSPLDSEWPQIRAQDALHEINREG